MEKYPFPKQPVEHIEAESLYGKGITKPETYPKLIMLNKVVKQDFTFYIMILLGMM
jgi:hypothetical protein